jgi:hypothetical protein
MGELNNHFALFQLPGNWPTGQQPNRCDGTLSFRNYMMMVKFSKKKLAMIQPNSQYSDTTA